MLRSLKFNLKFANKRKIQLLQELELEYKKAVNYYLKLLSNNRYFLSQEEIKSFNSPLSYAFKQCAERQAVKIWKSWRKCKKRGKLPEFDGTLILDQRFITIERSKTLTFDYWMRVSTLNKGKRTLIPFRSYNYANKYFTEWKLVNGGRIKRDGNNWFLLLTFEKETPKKKKEGKIIGVDIGIKKLITTSEKEFLGKDIERLMNKIQKKQQGSKAFKRALKERDYYINKIAKQLPYNDTKVIVMENIKNIKKNTKKEKKLRKEFRSKFQRWTYAKLLSRIKQLCELNGVHFHTINPAYTSQTCSKCGSVHRLNRCGEMFSCRNCGYTEDADFVASENILKAYLAQEPMVPGRVKAQMSNHFSKGYNQCREEMLRRIEESGDTHPVMDGRSIR